MRHVKMSLAAAQREMRDYYTPLRADRVTDNLAYQARRERIWASMDQFDQEHPGCHPCLVKARLHEVIADECEPVVFPHSPFFFEMGVRPAESWGTPNGHSAATWIKLRRQHVCHDTPEFKKVQAFYGWNPKSAVNLWLIWDVFDSDHHCLGYSRLLKVGINGILDDLAARRRAGVTAEQEAFLEAAERSCRALLKVAGRFAAAAAAKLNDPGLDSDARHSLGMMATAALRVPAEPPQTFYEGLASLLFLREATTSFESIGISVMGHLDRLLIGLYRADLATGRLTEAEARDLLARWMAHTDIKFHIEDSAWPETSTCMELGGCDENGVPVDNELTRLIIDVHRSHGFLNPKPNCRYSAASSADYLETLSSAVLAKHNNFAFLNDDVLIPAAMLSGKTEQEARLYVNGGCQEPMVEGVEHSAGAYYYFNLVRVLDLCLQPVQFTAETMPPADVMAAIPPVIRTADNFPDYYQQFLTILRNIIIQGSEWVRVAGVRWPEVLPCPLFSIGLKGCIENAADYTTGSAKYNPSGIALVGFATLVDSLLAIKTAVFEEKWLSLEELQTAVKNNWAGREDLRLRLATLPKFGHGDTEADGFAAALAAELAALARNLKNERDSFFQPSLFVYYMFVRMGVQTRATPDGRRDGELLSQGIAPSRIRPPESLTDVFRSIATIDFREFPGNAVLDVQLPAGGSLTPPNLAAVMRTFARMGGATLQLNCVSVEELKDAQFHPDQHRNLTVRISGLSARFVALTKDIQDEIISRTLYKN